MRLFLLSALVLLVFMLVDKRSSPQKSIDEDQKAKTPPALVMKVLNKYLAALEAKDLQAMIALADVPWLDRDRRVVRNHSDLGQAVERVATQLPRDNGRRKIEVIPYKQMRGGIENDAEYQLLNVILSEVLGENGWLVVVDEGITLLIRAQGGKAAVVGGPLKQNQITHQNRIPETVERLFDTAETFELYSLDPDITFQDRNDFDIKKGFYGWHILGKTEVKGMAERKRLTDALRLGAEDNYGMNAFCFDPRHGLRLKSGGQTVDLVICFECLQVEVFVDGKKQDKFLTTGEPQKEFDATLKAAGVQLAKPPAH